MFDVEIKSDLKGVARLSKRFPGVSKDVRLAAVIEAVNLIEREVKLRTPVGAGPIHLRDTIHGRAESRGATVWGVVGTPLEHGEPVEFGTKPHFPPLGPIEFWVEKKLGLSGDEAHAAAFLIARKIAAHGTMGAHMFEKGFEAAKDRVNRILAGIPDRIIEKVKR